MTIAILILVCCLLLVAFAIWSRRVESDESAPTAVQATTAPLGGANPSPPPIDVEAEIESRAPDLRTRVAPAP